MSEHRVVLYLWTEAGGLSVSRHTSLREVLAEVPARWADALEEAIWSTNRVLVDHPEHGRPAVIGMVDREPVSRAQPLSPQEFIAVCPWAAGSWDESLGSMARHAFRQSGRVVLSFVPGESHEPAWYHEGRWMSQAEAEELEPVRLGVWLARIMGAA